MQFRLAISALTLACAMPAFSQTAAPPAAGATPPPAWKQGIDNTPQPFTLHPFAPIMTGTEAKDIALGKLKVAPGFKVDVWADGVPTARSMALGDKGTVFVGNRVGKNVVAIVDKDGNESTYRFTKTRINAKLPKGIFNYAIPKGASVIDMRN